MSNKIIKTGILFDSSKLNSDEAVRYSIRLSSELWLECQKRALDEGYGAKGINKWVNHAIDVFLLIDKPKRNQIIQDISMQEVSFGSSGTYGIRLPPNTKEKVWYAMMESAWSGKDNVPPIYLEPSYAMVIKAAMINQLVE